MGLCGLLAQSSICKSRSRGRSGVQTFVSGKMVEFVRVRSSLRFRTTLVYTWIGMECRLGRALVAGASEINNPYEAAIHIHSARGEVWTS